MTAGPIVVVIPLSNEEEIVPISEVEWVLPKIFRFFFELLAYAIGVVIVYGRPFARSNSIIFLGCKEKIKARGDNRRVDTMVDKRPTKKQYKAAKAYCWRMYAHHAWFCGCTYGRDDEHVVGIEIRVDPEYTDRFTYATEFEGVNIKIVRWDPEKHGERYDRRK